MLKQMKINQMLREIFNLLSRMKLTCCARSVLMYNLLIVY